MKKPLSTKKLGYLSFLTTILLAVGFTPKAYGQSNDPGLCLKHTRTSPSGPINTGWVCAEAGYTSSWIGLGDDTGWKNQEIFFKATGNATLCLENSRRSPASGVAKHGACSHQASDVKTINLGDDSGWKDQKIIFSFHDFDKNHEVCFQHTSKNDRGNINDTGWQCTSENKKEIYIGDDSGWRAQKLRFKVVRKVAKLIHPADPNNNPDRGSSQPSTRKRYCAFTIGDVGFGCQ